MSENVDLYLSFKTPKFDTDTMIARQKYAHRCIRHTVPESSFHFIFAFLPNFRQSQPESRLSMPAFTNRESDGNQARR